MPPRATATATTATTAKTPTAPQPTRRPWIFWLAELGIFHCFWLILPLLLWNALVSLPGRYAPSIFWHDISPAIAYGENAARILVILLPLLMSAHIRRRTQRLGLLLYGVGLAVYAASWLALIFLPDSAWSSSLVGFLAPTYTPLVWAVGIALVGDRLHWRSGYRPWMYMALAAVFTAFHVSHAAIVFMRGE